MINTPTEIEGSNRTHPQYLNIIKTEIIMSKTKDITSTLTFSNTLTLNGFLDKHNSLEMSFRVNPKTNKAFFYLENGVMGSVSCPIENPTGDQIMEHLGDNPLVSQVTNELNESWLMIHKSNNSSALLVIKRDR